VVWLETVTAEVVDVPVQTAQLAIPYHVVVEVDPGTTAAVVELQDWQPAEMTI